MVKIECAKLGRPSFEKEGYCVISTLQGYTFNSASLQSLHLSSVVEETYKHNKTINSKVTFCNLVKRHQCVMLETKT